MRKILIILLTALLIGCEASTENGGNETSSQLPQTMLNAAVAGATAGTAGAIAHKATDKIISNYQQNKSQKSKAKRKK